MAPSAISPEETPQVPSGDSTVLALRKTLTSENEALAARFRALFSLKYLACQEPRTENTIPAIDAIAAGFASPSALLKHELAYCLGQSRHDAAVPYLQKVLSDREEDAMCRHEAAEAIGALGDKGSLKLLIERRDDENEETVVKETCDIAVGRIEWEHSDAGKLEKLKQRYGCTTAHERITQTDLTIVTSPRSTLLLLSLSLQSSPQSKSSNKLFLTQSFPCSTATAPCSLFATFALLPTFPPLFPLSTPSPVVSPTLLRYSVTRLLSSLVSFLTLPRFPP